MELGVDTGLDLKFTSLPCLHCTYVSWYFFGAKDSLQISHLRGHFGNLLVMSNFSLFLVSTDFLIALPKRVWSCLLSTLLMAQTICFRGSAFVLSPRSKLFVWSPWFVLIIKFYQDNLLVSSQYSLPQTCSQWFLPGKAYYHNLRKTLVMTSTSVKVNRSQEAPQDKKCSLFIYLSIYLSISEGWTNQWDNFSVTLSFMLTQSSDIKICLLCGHGFQRSYIFLTNRYV